MSNLKKFEKIKEKDINVISKETWKRMFNLHKRIDNKDLFDEIILKINNNKDKMDEYDLEFIDIELKAIIKEMTKKSYEKMIKMEGFSLYFYEKVIDLFINDKDELCQLEIELSKIEFDKVTFYEERNKENNPENFEGNKNEMIKKILEKSKSINEKKAKFRIRKIIKKEEDNI